jgi:hypothetical protein
MPAAAEYQGDSHGAGVLTGAQSAGCSFKQFFEVIVHV